MLKIPKIDTFIFVFPIVFVTTPLWAKCEDEIHIPKSGNLESSRTPKNLELDCRGQNTLHQGVFYIMERS